MGLLDRGAEALHVGRHDQVGHVTYGYGTSRLWHDPDYLSDRPLYPTRVEKALNHAYTGRKDRKSEYRSLWITRINAACREENLSYSRFIAGLKKAGLTLNRKMLADIAVKDTVAFSQMLAVAKEHTQ